MFDKCKAKFSKSIGCYDYITSLCIPPTARDTLKKKKLVSAAGLTDPSLRLMTTPAAKRANLGLQSFVGHHQFRQAAPLEPRMKNRKKKPWNKFHMGPLNNLAKHSRRFFSRNKFTVTQRMSMLPRLWVFYITEVFWKISKPRLFPQQNDSENYGLASRFLPRCFSCSAFKTSDRITGFISEPIEKPHIDGKPASGSYSRACV